MAACSITSRMPLFARSHSTCVADRLGGGTRLVTRAGCVHAPRAFADLLAVPRVLAGWTLIALLVAGCGAPPESADPSGAAPIEEAASVEADGDAGGKPSQPATVTSQGPPGRVLERSFDDVKFEMQQGDPFTPGLLPDAVASLDGQRIRIRGYILPSFQQEGITQFVLVRDNMECCFGPGAALYDCIVVRMVEGTSTNFSVRPVAVRGTFHVEELIGPDGRHLAIYSMDGEDVE